MVPTMRYAFYKSAYGTRRLWYITTFAAVSLALACLAYGCFVPRVSVGGLTAQIGRDLPIGTPRTEVEAWLKRRNLDFRRIADAETNREVGIAAEIKDAQPPLSVMYDKMMLEFYFDKDDKLVTFKVERRLEPTL